MTDAIWNWIESHSRAINLIAAIVAAAAIVINAGLEYGLI